MRASQGDTTMTVKMMTMQEARVVLVNAGWVWSDEINSWTHDDVWGWINEEDNCFEFSRYKGTYSVSCEPHNVAGLIADIRAGKYKN